jgi:hypothetical protein
MSPRKKITKAAKKQEGAGMAALQGERGVSSEMKGALAKGAEAQPSLLTSAVLIGIGALMEPELLAGMVIGAGLVFASKWIPDLTGGVLRPMVKTTVKVGYAVAGAVSEAVENVQDIVAEVHAEARAEAPSAQPQA